MEGSCVVWLSVSGLGVRWLVRDMCEVFVVEGWGVVCAILMWWSGKDLKCGDAVGG